jgi:hypothetical protein
MNTRLLGDALQFAARKWFVLPLNTPQSGGCSCQQEDCAIGKHPRTRHGSADATDDKDQIRAWWERWPDANIGIATGPASGLVVLDIDDRGEVCGSDNLADLATDFGGLPDTLTAITGNGKHLFFQHPGGTVKNSTGKLAYGVDVKADGGYVVAPPSLHASGTRYRWEDFTKPVAPLPEWLLGKMISKEEEKKVEPAEHTPFSDAAIVHEGSRNTTLYKLACALRGAQGMDHDEIAAILHEYNAAKCDPPLAEMEVLAITRSACQYPAEVSTTQSGKRQEQNPLYWLPFSTREWFSNQNLMLMSDAQIGQYTQLLMLAWDRGGLLTADGDKLWRLAKASSREAFEQGCELVLAEYEEVVVDGELMLRHPRLAAHYVKTLELWMKKKEAGEASRASRLAHLETQRSIVTEPGDEAPLLH